MHWLTATWWTYILNDSRADADYGTRFSRIMCRIRNHPAGVWWFSSGLEPDLRCRGCGENLG